MQGRLPRRLGRPPFSRRRRRRRRRTSPRDQFVLRRSPLGRLLLGRLDSRVGCTFGRRLLAGGARLGAVLRGEFLLAIGRHAEFPWFFGKCSDFFSDCLYHRQSGDDRCRQRIAGDGVRDFARRLARWHRAGHRRRRKRRLPCRLRQVEWSFWSAARDARRRLLATDRAVGGGGDCSLGSLARRKRLSNAGASSRERLDVGAASGAAAARSASSRCSCCSCSLTAFCTLS